MTTDRTIAHVHLHGPAEDVYRRAFEVMADLTPVVQALPPHAALLDLSGALGYFDRTPAALGKLLQVKILARFGLQSTVGIGSNPLLATLAAQTAVPTTVRVLPQDPGVIDAFLGPLPVRALPDIGPKTGNVLAGYGLHTVADLRAVPVPTVQRITGTALGRLLSERAHGRDPRRVQPAAPPATLGARRDFPRDTLDPATTSRSLLSCAEELGAALRVSGQVAGRLELEVRFADRSTTTRTRTLREPTDHTIALQHHLQDLYTALGLQRARQRALTVRAQDLRPVETAAVQLTFDRRTEQHRRLDPVIDRAVLRFGTGAVTRAALVAADGHPMRPAC